MKHCGHCGARIAMRPDQTWVHVATRSRHCSEGPIPRPAAAPAPEASRPAAAPLGDAAPTVG